MSRSSYNWIILREDGETQTRIATSIGDLFFTLEDTDTITAIIKQDLA
jgi:hypothetical protein